MSFHDDNILDAKSTKTAHFAEPGSQTLQSRELASIYTSNFAYHLLQQLQNSENTRTLPYITYLINFISANYSLPSLSSFSEKIKDLADSQKGPLISIDFDKFNNRILALIKHGDRYKLLNYIISEKKDTLYELNTNEPIIFEAKYFSPYNSNFIMLIGTDQIFIINMHEFEANGHTIIDLTLNPAFTKINVPFKTPELVKIIRMKNSTSVSISKGNSYLIFWSPFSKWIHIYTYYNNETTQYKLSHYIDAVEFSHINTEIVILYDSKKDKRAITILNLKKGYQQTLDISSNLIKRECDYRRLPLIENNTMVANLAGKADKIVIVKHGCLIVYENTNYDLNYFDLNVGPMKYKLKTVVSLLDKPSSETAVLNDYSFKIETSPINDLVNIYSTRMSDPSFYIFLNIYDLNTNNLFKRVIVEKVASSINETYYNIVRLSDYPSLSISNIYNKKYFVLFTKSSFIAEGSNSRCDIKIFQVDG